jgi:hypothetical protein
MAKLSDLGFSKDSIVEIIVSTYDSEGRANAAPMGAIMHSEQDLAINFYNSSNTLRNIQSSKCAVINVTFDINHFYRTAFKEDNPDGIVPQDWFTKAETINAPQLKDASAFVEAKLKGSVELDPERTKTFLSVVFITVQEMYPKAHSRAFAATVESIIHATRIQVFLSDGEKRREVQNLIEKFEICRETVNRTAPESTYSEIMEILSKKIDTWRKKRDENPS